MSEPPPVLCRPDHPLTDGVVTLDAFTRDDVLDIVRAIDDEIVRWLPLPDPYGETEARAFVAATPNTAAAGAALNFAIRCDARLAGSIGVTAVSGAGHAQMGYWVAPHARNRGVARRAVRLLAGHMFDTAAPPCIEILMHPGNTASRRVAEHVGATYRGIRPDALVRAPGAPAGEAAVYTLVATPVAR